MDFVSPAEWGARVDYDSKDWRPWNPEKWVIHYGGGANFAGSEDKAAARGYSFPSVDAEKRVLRIWERYHIDSKGWLGIAYNYAVGQSGTIYRLRGENRSGATSGDEDHDGIPANYEARAVVFILGGDQRPTEAALESFRALYRGFGDLDRVTVHSDYSSTSCPGDHLRAWVDEKGYLDMAFTKEEEKVLKDFVRGIKDVGSNGYGVAKYSVLLIREERDKPLHRPEDNSDPVDTVARSKADVALAAVASIRKKLRNIKEVL